MNSFEAELNNINKNKMIAQESYNNLYANILVTTSSKINQDNIKLLLNTLQSPDTKKFISEKYKGNLIVPN